MRIRLHWTEVVAFFFIVLMVFLGTINMFAALDFEAAQVVADAVIEQEMEAERVAANSWNKYFWRKP